MRDLFDQYDLPENRLTHALVCCLAEDPRLMRRFIRWATGTTPPPTGRLQIVEQSLPGDCEPAEDDAERGGVPDAWIHDGDRWSLIIESKVAARLSVEQLYRHRRTARRRGFEQIALVAITVDGRSVRTGREVRVIRWADLYRWCRKEEAASTWAGRLATYLEVAEAKMVGSNYLRDGALTVFSGVPFDGKNRYTYTEAKRVLGLIMEEMRNRRDLRRELQVDHFGPGRPAITGRDVSNVWDIIPLRVVPLGATFTQYPHLDISIRAEETLAVTVFPSNVKPWIRRNLLDLGRDGFCDLMRQTARRLCEALRYEVGAVPWGEVVQRRFPSRNSVPIVDARLHYDLRAAVEIGGATRHSPVKLQPQWLTATWEALAEKRSNLQLAIGAIFPYERCPAIHTPKATDIFAATWIACKPMLDAALRGARTRGAGPRHGANRATATF